MSADDERYRAFPPGFFQRVDEAGDGGFYAQPRLVTHIDEAAMAAVGRVYEHLGIEGRVLDLMSSWVSHFRVAPGELIALGMNRHELASNEMARGAVLADLNRTPELPFADASFDGGVCCVSVDYLVQPLEVFDEVARVLRPGAPFCCTFSNRCFPTKAIAGWLNAGDHAHLELVGRYFELSTGWGQASATIAIEPGRGQDPLFAVWADRID